MTSLWSLTRTRQSPPFKRVTHSKNVAWDIPYLGVVARLRDQCLGRVSELGKNSFRATQLPSSWPLNGEWAAKQAAKSRIKCSDLREQWGQVWARLGFSPHAFLKCRPNPRDYISNPAQIFALRMQWGSGNEGGGAYCSQHTWTKARIKPSVVFLYIDFQWT